MAIDLSNKVSAEDEQAVRGSKNNDNVLSEADVADFFDDLDTADDLFSDFEAEGSTSSSSSNSNGNNSWGTNNNNGNNGNGWGNNNNQNGTVGWGNTQVNQQPKEKDTFDQLVDATVDVSKDTFSVLKQLWQSLGNRTLDDYGYIATVEINYGIIMMAIGAVGILIATITSMNHIGVMLFVNTLVCGMVTLAIGLGSLYTSAMLLHNGVEIGASVENIPDATGGVVNSDSEELDGLWDDLFGDEGEDEDDDFLEDDATEDSWFSEDTSGSYDTSMFDVDDNKTEEIDKEELLNNILENTVITRKQLVDTFKNLLPKNTPAFHTQREIPSYEASFNTIETICLKALANLCDCHISEVDSKVEKLNETAFSYEIYLKRIKKISNLKSIEREIEAYFRSDSTDYAVTAHVDIEGDFYKITVSKGETAIVTIGDVLGYSEYYDKIVSEKMRLPIIYGIDELGNIELGDAQICDSMMIAGKQRSGKSWFLLGVLMTLMMFNSPELVQFILIDPKETALFETLSLMPHVAGLHNDKHILDVLDDVINNEGAYRKKLLKDNRCDTIWELWDKGIKLPIIYICIDEYITAQKSLGQQSKELDDRLLVIMTQFPSQGIRVCFIPHRATGVVDKTNRSVISLKVGVRTDLDDTRDTIGDTKWNRPLVNPGDMGMLAPGMMKPKFMRGVTLGRNDSENREIIETVAKAFYKMGVDLPDMGRMVIACNRDSEKTRAQLTGESIREQYSANSIYSILDED